MSRDKLQNYCDSTRKVPSSMMAACNSGCHLKKKQEKNYFKRNILVCVPRQKKSQPKELL